MSRPDELAAGLAAVEDRITRACTFAGRDRGEVTLVAVTKTWPAGDVALLRDLGVRDVGENKDAEAAAKARLVEGVRWHFVGRLQTNKARSVATYAEVVHSVDRERLATALADGAARAGRNVQVLLQVSLDGAPDRGGVPPAGLLPLAGRVAALEGLVLRGVMAVAPLGEDPRAAFGRLAEAAVALRAAHPGATWVSAGMSNDLEAAVGAGATHLRVGTALLGHRAAVLR